MKFPKLKLILIAMCTFLSCSKEPIACFKVLTENPKAGEPTIFQNCSTFGRGDTFWDFGDSTEINRNPMPEVEHIFSKKGEYEINLRVTLGRRSDEITQLITVN